MSRRKNAEMKKAVALTTATDKFFIEHNKINGFIMFKKISLVFRNLNIFRVITYPEITASNWQFPAVVLQTASYEDLDLLLSEAHNKIQSLSNGWDSITNKSTFLYSLSMTAFTGCFAYIFTHFHLSYINICLASAAFFLYTICSVLKYNIKTAKVFGYGTSPELLAKAGMFTNLDGRQPKWYLAAHLVLKYNERIAYNKEVNNLRISYFDECFIRLSFIPAFWLLIGLTLLIFSPNLLNLN